MLYIIQFQNKPDSLELHKKLKPEHLKYLDGVKDKVLVPGSIWTVPDDTIVGGLWIVEAQDEDEARRLATEDPFYTDGLRESYTIYRYNKGFPDRKTLV